MSKFLKLFGVAALVGLSVPAKASAATVFSWSGCGGASFASCATVVATYSGGALVFTVENTNGTTGWPGGFSDIGWSGLGGTVAASGHTATGGSGNWAFNSPISELGGGYIGFSATPANPANRLTVGSAKTMTFTMYFTVAPTFENFTFGLREIGFDTAPYAAGCGTSNKLYVNLNGNPAEPENYNPNIGTNSDCFPDDGTPTDIVPEPATMVLLATGLIGLAGAQLRRRKNTKV